MTALSFSSPGGSQSRVPSAVSVMPYLLSGRPPAVHDYRCAVYERSLLRAQEEGQLCDLFRLDKAFDRGLREHDLLDHLVLGDPMDPGLVRYLLLHQRRLHVRRVYAVGGDASGPTLQSKGLGEPLQTVLGRDVRGLVRRGPQVVYGGDVDDAPPPLLVHPRQRLLEDPERSLEHNPQYEREALGRELLDGRDVLQPRVVHDDIRVYFEVVEHLIVGEVGL